MPATTRPRSTRPHSPRSPARPRTARPSYRSATALVGLTVDTELGFVDLVAVRRAIRGDDRVRLTEAELDWIRNRQPPGARRQAAHALGTGYTGLLKDLARHRKRIDRADAKEPAGIAARPF